MPQDESSMGNRFGVAKIPGAGGDRIRLDHLPTQPVLSPAECINLAAWLVAVADDSPNHVRFLAHLEEILDGR